MTLAAGTATTAYGNRGKIQYMPHNADRSKCGLLNVLPRTSSLASPPRGSQRGIVPRGSPSKHFLSEYRNFLRCAQHLCRCRPRLARSPGGLGGRSRIEFIVSPLSRRRHNESHFAAQSPERAFLAKPFFARAKNGVNSGRRSLKISVGKTKPDSEPSPPRGRCRVVPLAELLRIEV